MQAAVHRAADYLELGVVRHVLQMPSVIIVSYSVKMMAAMCSV